MSTKKKHGFCVYTFAHGGIGRTIEESDDFIKKGKELKKQGAANEIYNVVCDADKKRAIKKYNVSIKNKKNKNGKTKRGGFYINCGLSQCRSRRKKRRGRRGRR